MPVYLRCEQCQKRLKIPEHVLGRLIKCPACGAVFKSEASKVLPAVAGPGPSPIAEVLTPVAAAPAPPGAAHAEDEDIFPAHKKARAVEDEQPARPSKKAAVIEDEDEDVVIPAPKRAAAVVEEEDEDDEDIEETPAPPRRLAEADEEPEEVEELEAADEAPRKAKRGTPWYVMLPLIVLSLLPVPLAWVWTYGAAQTRMYDTLRIDFDESMYIGLGCAVGLTLLCFIVALIPLRAWLRFVLVLLLLLLGYGGSLGLMYWSASQPFAKKIQVSTSPERQRGGLSLLLAGAQGW